jgi:hypothetical protein
MAGKDLGFADAVIEIGLHVLMMMCEHEKPPTASWLPGRLSVPLKSCHVVLDDHMRGLSDKRLWVFFKPRDGGRWMPSILASHQMKIPRAAGSMTK